MSSSGVGQDGEVKGMRPQDCTGPTKKDINRDDTTDAVEPREYEPPEGTQEAASKNEGMGNNPDFSLAAHEDQNPNSSSYQNPSHGRQNGEEQDNPTFSLAQPLPHIVRPGMRHGALPEDRKEDRQTGQDPTEGRKQDQPTGPRDDEFFNSWSKIRHYLREPLAEWLGVSTRNLEDGNLPNLSNRRQPSQ